jgi:Mn2+/Fe2+ NRAMP family transporter
LFRGIALGVLAIGTLIALLGVRPVEVILFAQIANGLILPVIAAFLLIAMNRKRLLGSHMNSWLANMLGIGVVAITFGLGLRLILRALNVWA